MAANLNLGISFGPNQSPMVVAAGFATMGMSVKSFREPLKKAIKDVLIPSFKKNFDMGGRPSWAPLTETTVSIREREGFPGAEPILVRTGALRRVAQQQNIWTIDNEKAFVRDLPSKVWYGIVQQHGTLFAGSQAIPSRPFLIIQPEDEDDIVEVFDDWLAEKMRKAGWTVANV